MDAEKIDWVDSYGSAPSWERLGEIDSSVLVCQSVGWVVHEDDESVVIAPHRALETEHTDSQVSGHMTIPKVAIRSRTPISFSGAS